MSASARSCVRSVSEKGLIEIARKGKYQEWLEPDGLLMLEGWARDGLTDEQICKNLRVGHTAFNEWKNRFPEIAEALKKGRGPVDIEVENALLKRATGYTVTLKKPIKIRVEKRLQGKGTIIEETIQYVEEEHHVPADTTAQIFWLKHRKAARWGERAAETDGSILQRAREILGGVGSVIE